MFDEKNKTRLSLYGNMFLAVLLGVYAQDIAYFLNNTLKVPLLTGITAATIFSISFFIFPPILATKANRDRKVGKREFNIYLVINILIGIIISFFSLIVLIAWWG